MRGVVALDQLGLKMIASRVKGAAILCLGYPDITAPLATVKALLGVEPRKWTDHGAAHKVSWRLPETIDTLMLAGALSVDCVDSMPSRGVEKKLDLNVRQEWPRRYELVINPGTIEHCFDIAAAMFNAWRAVAVGGVILHVAPVTMVNHGFWNLCPTVIHDFAQANAGLVERIVARDRQWADVPLKVNERFTVLAETVLYALVRKVAESTERVPTQWRYWR